MLGVKHATGWPTPVDRRCYCGWSRDSRSTTHRAAGRLPFRHAVNVTLRLRFTFTSQRQTICEDKRSHAARRHPSASLPDLLHRVFGHREFRPHQQEVCEAAADGARCAAGDADGRGQEPLLSASGAGRGRNGTGNFAADRADGRPGRQAGRARPPCRPHPLRPVAAKTRGRPAAITSTATLDFLFIAPERCACPASRRCSPGASPR